jgi:cobalt-zinc-cadmium efflux system membrane fusion protein
MPIHDHQPKFLGSAFFWGGIGLGVLLLVGLLTHGFGLFGRGAKGQQSVPAFTRQGQYTVVPEGSALRKELTVAAALVQPVNPRLQFPAVVESDPVRTVAVLPPLAGRVLALKVALGDRVAQGQVLAIIDSADLAQAYADFDKASDSFQLTQKNLQRQEAQHKLGIASDRDLDQARSDNTQASADYLRAEQRLHVIGAPLARLGAGRTLTITAPVPGSIVSLSAAVGAMINDPTQPLMTVADLSSVWVTAMVAEKDLGSVAKNQAVQISMEAYPGRQLDGKVLFVSDVLEPDTRRNKIRVSVANPDYALKPNMFGIVTLSGAQRSEVVLPSSALLMNNDRSSVFVATRPWTFERRTVETLLEEGSSVVITSGVRAGEQVVIKGGILLND